MSGTSPFILGLEPSIPGSFSKSTEELYQLVGQNTGNLAFHHAIYNQIGKPRSIPWNAAPEAMDAAGDIGVIPAANQLGPHANFAELGRRFDGLNCSLVAIGLGAQSTLEREIPEIPTGTLNWVKSIVDHAPSDAPNITVRGPFTQKVLDHYGFQNKSIVLGCPSLFINPDPELGQQIAARSKNPRRIAVSAGHPNWKSLAPIEQSLARLVDATGGSYIGQATLEMVQMTRGEANKLPHETLRRLRDYIRPEMTMGQFEAWAVYHGNVFFDIDAWLEHCRRFDLVIGGRIHGTILALQAGVPAVCVAHDSRTEELCQTMQIPYVRGVDHASGIPRAALPKLMAFDGAAFDAHRCKLARNYVEFLLSNRLEPAPSLVALAEG